MQRILPPPVAKLCLALLCLVLLMNTTTAAAQKQEADDQGWSYPTSKPTTPFGGGSGSQNDPYLITKAQHLANLSYMINDGEKYKGKYFRMTRDIVLNDNMMSEDGKFNKANASSYTEWKTMGSMDMLQNYKQFCGFFDGGGHTIYGVYQSYTVESESRKWHGFFYRVGDGIVSNLTISHSYIYTNARRTQEYRGIFCCEAENSTFSNCHVKNSYIHERSEGWSYKALGGFLGRGYKTELRDCSFKGTIEVDAYSTLEDMSTGGLVGKVVKTSKITDCKASGNIIIKRSKGYDGDGQVAAGGIFGMSYLGVSVSRCLNTMDIVVHHENSADEMCAIYAGGIGGYVNAQDSDENSFSQCVNMGNIVIGASGETFEMKKRLMMLSGIANLYQSTVILFSSTVNVSDCANYGNIQLKAGSITSNNSDEKLLAAGCCALYTKITGTLKTNWKRCINVSNGNDMTAGGLTMRYAPIMGIMDRPDDAEYIKMEKPCYYNTNISNVLNPVSSVSDTKLELFYHKTPFALTATTPSWTFLTDKESTTWAGYAVPYTPFFTKTSLLGSGTETDPYLITNEKELLSLNTFMGNKGDAGYSAYYCLENDLDMTNMGTFPTIVNGNTGFIGTFDGNGHYINGLRVSRDAMFDRIGKGGVVKNLMLTNFRGNDADNYNSSIAGFHFGTIEDCSVFGTVSSRLSQTSDHSVTAAGIARTVYDGGVIRRCMFKGTLKASPKTSNGETSTSEKIGYEMSGITLTTSGTVEQCYASFKIDMEMEEGCYEYNYIQGIGRFGTTQGSGVTPVLRNCAYVCAETTITVDGAKQCASEADITLDLLGDTKSEGWLKGAYRPVNKHNKHLTVTDHNSQTTYLDLCPDDAWTPNKVYTDTLTQDNAEDRLLQQFKNLALYNPQSQTAYIIDLELDRSKSSFDYKPLDGCTATKGATRITLKKDEALADAPGHYLLCLPCPLRTADLPAGSEIHGLGYNAANEENTNQFVFYLTECDSVGAGVPCHVYIPDCVSGDFTLLSYGNIVSAPQGTAAYGPQGYFAETPVSRAFTGILLADGSQTPEYLTYTEGPTTMKLFSAAATSEKRSDNQWLTAIKVLDESDPYLYATLCSLHEKEKDNIYLKRKLWGNEWNTLTLPFDVSVESLASYAGVKNIYMEAEELTSITTDTNGGIVLNFSKVKDLQAGKPYLVRPTDNCTGFDFLNITTTINALLTAVPVSNDQYEVTMHPNYAPLVLVAGDYFLQDDQFYVVAEGMTVPSLGMRAHFTANAAASKALQSARLVHADGDVTGIDGITRPDATNAAVYDLSGRRVEKPAHGLYIVNGRKVLLP